MKSTIVGLVIAALAGCSSPNPSATCDDGTCSDPRFPYCDGTGAVGGEPGSCIAVTCTPEQIHSCEQDEALTCTATGDGYKLVPCSLGCAESPSPHCKYLQPRYLPDACDQPATDSLAVTSTGSIDPNLDPICTGGIFDQVAAPDVCMIHYKTISISQSVTLSVLGKVDTTGRSVALIADEDLVIDGTLDVSGHPRVNGPGGGVISGTSAGSVDSDSADGGGGAGGATAGAAGGHQIIAGGGTDGGGSSGGAATANPALLAEFVGGGASWACPTCPINNVLFGGGGGAVMLISCRGTVRIQGAVSAGGGGGVGGTLVFGNLPGYGGGAGGVVSVEGTDIAITGSLFANGGGGGAGTVNSTFEDGADGSMSDSVAAQGGMVFNAGAGGAGGIIGNQPSVGKHAPVTGASAGGGGGSVGFLQLFAPSGVTPTITPAHVSPALPPTNTALTR
jgi:hypothetical protein